MSRDGMGASCPLPDDGEGDGDGDRITLAHGEGGRLMHALIRDRIAPILWGAANREMGDAHLLPGDVRRLAVSTDGFVVSPLAFPGGDIGSLAVFGVVNDLAMAGARAKWLSLALIIEEGLAWRTLESVLRSVASAARRTGVEIVTGDTKVVPRGAADKLFLTVTGIGELCDPIPPGPRSITVGDCVLVSGPIGRHGVAVMAAREQLEFDPPPCSDSAPLLDAVQALQRAGVPVTAMRDATRGGAAAVLHEWAESCGHSFRIAAESLPVSWEVRGVCELLGLNPLHVANEGTMLLAVPASAVAAALEILHSVPESQHACRIGEVVGRAFSPVMIRQPTGVDVPLDEPLGAPLPRIC